MGQSRSGSAWAIPLRGQRDLGPAELVVMVCLVSVATVVAAALTHPLLLWLVVHIGLTAVAGLSIRRALSELDRGPFWFGVFVAGLVVLTRFLEFETGLLFKAGVFTVAGIAVLTIGYAFESRRREVMSHG